MRLTLVRHGETTGESSIRYYGATDVPLSALGMEQMARAGAVLAGERFDALYSSRLARSREGARLVARGQLEPIAVAAFDEVDFGRWEGWTREEIAARDAAAFVRWQAAPEDFVYPEGECRQAFRRRVSAGLAALLADVPGDNLLLVVHRGVIAMILAELLQLAPDAPRRLEIDLGSIHVVSEAAWSQPERTGRSASMGNRFGGPDGGWTAEQLNRIDHLTAPLAMGAVR